MSISGKYLTATIDGTEIFDNYAWDAAESGDELDRTTGAFAGYSATDVGVKSCRVTIKGYMDVTTGQYVAVKVSETNITNLKLYRSSDDATPAFEFPEATIVKSRQGGEVKGKIEWQAEIVNYGEYTANDP